MEIYHLNPTLMSENLERLVYNPKGINFMSDIPAPVKGKLTREYNKRHEQTKMKIAKAKKAAGEVNHFKFHPELEDIEEDDMVEEEEEEEEKEDEVIVEQKKTKKKK